MEEKKGYIEILFGISKILKEKYNLCDQDVSEYINEYGLLELYKYCPDEVGSFSCDILAKDIFEAINAERALESQNQLLLKEEKGINESV